MNTNFLNYNSEIIKAEDYLKLTELEKANIESTQIIPPSLEEGNFGKILIIYKYAQYKKI